MDLIAALPKNHCRSFPAVNRRKAGILPRIRRFILVSCRISLFALFFHLTACATTQETLPSSDASDSLSQHPYLQQARFDLEEVVTRGNEWLIVTNLTKTGQVSLSGLMELADQAAKNENPKLALDLATLVSKYANLALAQHRSNLNSRPIFPEPQ